jgi:zinc protease
MKIMVLIFTLFVALNSWAGLKEFQVDKFKLKNGMRVLLHQDSSLPIYSLHLWYDVGSSDEEPNRTGLAHFFEHLMFKGTVKNDEGVYDDLIEENGGSNNAFTTRDYTGYYVEMPSGTLETVLKLEADRMVNLKLTKDKIKREREVVKEERRLRVENSPFGLAFESLFQNGYARSSYRWPVIGSMKHLENSSVRDFQNFYDRYYSPNNAILIIAGDFRKAKAKSWIKKYFSKLQPKAINRNVEGPKALSNGGKTVKIKKPVQSKIIATSLPGVSIHDVDAHALDLLSLIIANGKASRIYREMVDGKKYLLSTDSWNFTPSGKGLLLLFNSLRPGVSSSKVSAELKSILSKTQKTGVTEVELKAAKKQLKLSSLSEFKTLSGKARGLATNEILFGDYKRMFTEIDRYEAVTLAQINKVAKKYLDVKKLNFIEVGK